MKTDAEFIESFKKSRPVVRAAAQWLRGHNYEVIELAQKVRPDRSQIAQYRDKGDLLVRIDGRWGVVEVKQVKFRPLLKLAQDPDRMIVIDNASSHRRTNPCNYVIADLAGTFGVVKVKATRDLWRWVTRYIHSDDEVKEVIEAPMRAIELYEDGRCGSAGCPSA